ncbi:MAG: potassium-transporting ATPase subunit KdpC [Planctomycetota bacterium]
MFTLIKKQLRPALVSLAVFTVLTGVLYPALVTGVAQTFFTRKANGSPIIQNGEMVGSELIGQPFSDPRYFWGRPSATSPFPYNAALSGGSNLGPANPTLEQAVADRIRILREADPDNDRPIPADLVTASASGLDPHITPAAATYQVPRVARARGIGEKEIARIVAEYTEGRQFDVLGEARVNVLRLNLALDALHRRP